MKKVLGKIINKKALAIFFVILVCFAFANFAFAADTQSSFWSTLGGGLSTGVGYAVASVLSWIASIVVAVFGYLLTLLIKVLVNVAGFSNIINVPAVEIGWKIVRDICNMFFILILLLIAFATILRVESYQWKKTLPKLIIMAVLINFSRTICGLIIDFSQVIMLTFVNGFGQYAPANLISLFQVDRTLNIATKVKADVTDWSIAISIILGMIAIIITTIVVLVLLAILIMRIIMLWVYTILSPIAFLASAFPQGQKYASQWWSEFSKNVIVGPVLAFFIWLALTTAEKSSSMLGTFYDNKTDICAGLQDLFCEANFQKFIITIGLLVGGLIVTQQVGGIAGSLASRGLGWAKKTGAVPLAIGKFSLFKAGRMADNLQIKGQKSLAKGVSWATRGYVGEKYQAKSLNYRMIAEGWKRNQAVKMREYEGTKAGAWQDQFNRTLSASVGVPIISQVMRKRNEKKIIDNEAKIVEIQKEITTDKETMEKTNNENELKIIKGRIKSRETEIVGFKRDNRKLATKTATLGKLPIQKYARLEEQQKANEEHSNIKKEDLNEEGLVHNFQTEGRIDKKRAYLMHLADINGINSLFDARGEDMNFKNINKLFKEFGDAAGDVAAEVSRRAEAAGNYKLMGFHRFDVTQGRNRLANDDEQLETALIKDKERYAQNHARTTHFDSLVDRHADGTTNLSRIGLEQLLHIASNEGRMREIKNGNYQIRYGETVINLEADIEEKINMFNASGETGKAENLKKVLDAFKANYGKYGKKKMSDKNTDINKKNDGKSILVDHLGQPFPSSENKEEEERSD
ncbi:MAG: hypothetical protein ABH830_03275 [Patescibacteria group bacterium]